jgi:CP family cyanate transporter-like MFS transporter
VAQVTSTASGTRSRVRAGLPWAFVVTLVLVAVNLRSPFVAVAPIAVELRADLGVGGGAIGLLTSLPVLCFGLFAPVALLVVRRAGAEAAVVTCLASVVVGSVVRSSASFGLAVVGTVVIGLGITVGNIVVPVLIRRESPARTVGVVTGIYVSAMNVGSMVVSVATPPMADVLGWRLALAAWGVMAAVGLVAWLLFVRRRRRQHREESAARARSSRASTTQSAPAPRTVSPWRVPLAWLLALAFAGQATSYYSLTAWLPTLLADEIGLGASAAGAASSVFQVSAIIGALGVPLLALRWPSWVAIGLVGLLWMAFPLQLLLAPQAYLLGSVLGGVAQGGGFAALFTVVVHVSRSDRESAQLSAFVQGVGYVAAALGPTVLGVVHDATGAWTAPVLIIVGTTATFSVLGVAAGVAQSRRHPAP